MTASRDGWPCHHPDGMGRNTKKAAVIAAGVEITHVEIPVVRGKYVKVGLHQLPPAEFKFLQQRIHPGVCGQGL